MENEKDLWYTAHARIMLIQLTSTKLRLRSGGGKENSMDLTEKKLSGELKYTGVIVSVTLDEVELVDGHKTLREVVATLQDVSQTLRDVSEHLREGAQA